MYIRRKIRWRIVLRFAWLQIIVFGLWGTAVTFCYTLLRERGIDCSLPIAPLGTIGVAVALYVGFKNNQAYDRYWEARKIWGGIVNVSRSWGNLVLSFVSGAHTKEAVAPEVVKEAQRTLIYRQIAWINVLRFQLRRKTSWGFQPRGSPRKLLQPTDVEAMKEHIHQLLPESELNTACVKVNTATQLLRMHGEDLRRIVENKARLIEDFRLIALMDLVTEMFALQGKCERIKNSPFPRQYAYFSSVFVWIFVVLLPFGLVGELATRGNLMLWLTVPVSIIVSWIFYTMETVGDSSEDPFENFINDVPMTALCRTIEIDLRQMLGETEIPEPIEPVNDILM